ncbi:MAG TPA: glycosyltransferase family 4 protein [Pirellulaceae bacterium]|nr:glycosyltransferase family 4 protein [Pirellulaceae bacterium]
MNILYLTNNAGRASTTVPTKGWYEHLIPRGLSPVLVSPLTGEFQESIESRGLPFYKLALPFPDKWRPWPFLSSLWKLARIVRKHRIQLIHCNEQDVYPIGQNLARWLRVPVVVSIHFTMGRPFCQWAFGGKRQPDRIFFISPGNLAECRPGVTGIIDESRWRMLYNGLDLTHFTVDAQRRESFRREHGLEHSVALGVACALRGRKQLEHLFELGQRIRDPRVKIVVAGGSVPDEQEYAEKLIADAKAKLGERLVYLGYLTELRDFYNGLDLFVNTSREEACSISVLESMACGCPVVGYPSKSVDGQILPGGGEITPQDDVPALQAAVESWLSDNQKLADGREGARRRVEVAFDIRKLSYQLFDEYQSLVAGGAKRKVA